MTSGYISERDEPDLYQILRALKEALKENPRLSELPTEEIAKQLVLGEHVKAKPATPTVAEALHLCTTIQWLPNKAVCAACGKYWEELLPHQSVGNLCEECSARANSGEGLRILFGDTVWTKRPLEIGFEELSAEQRLEMRFEGLFRAARVLIRERADESRVIPTLAFEGLELQTGGSGRAWDQEQAQIYENNIKVRPVEIVDGALILEWREVAVVAGIESEGSTPPEVVIEIASRPKPASPEQVANAYEEALKAQGVPCDIETEGNFRYLESMHHLYLTLMPVERPFPPDESSVSFPAPQRVEEIYSGLLRGELGRRLSTRKRGRGSEPDNLVPAIVAFFLRAYGGINSPKEIHRILNEHVLKKTWKTKLPEGGTGTSEATQLWANVKRTHKQLVSAMHTF